MSVLGGVPVKFHMHILEFRRNDADSDVYLNVWYVPRAIGISIPVFQLRFGLECV